MLNMSMRTEAFCLPLLQEFSFQTENVETQRKKKKKNMQQTLENAWQLVVAQRR